MSKYDGCVTSIFRILSLNEKISTPRETLDLRPRPGLKTKQ